MWIDKSVTECESGATQNLETDRILTWSERLGTRLNSICTAYSLYGFRNDCRNEKRNVTFHLSCYNCLFVLLKSNLRHLNSKLKSQ